MSFTVSKTLQFPEPSLQFIPVDEFSGTPREGLTLLSGLLSNVPYVWHAKGPCLEVRNTRSGAKVSSWTFGRFVKDSSTSVVCVEEVENGKLPLLAIGLECALSGGFICIFDICSSRVVHTIQVNDKISSLHVVDSGCETLNLPGPLRNYDGILAVGTQGGNVYLVDLCRQICEESLQSPIIKDKINPYQLLLLTQKDVHRIEFYKQLAVQEGNHLAIHLNFVLNSTTQHFTLKNPNGEDKLHVNKEEVRTSAVSYCSQLTSLLIGFNFGAFQLWDLTTLSLIYTSPVHEEHVPITRFSLQEPADDPRAFCYVWAVYSNPSLYQEGFPFAVMYSLCYETKDFHEGYGYLYQDFQHCSVRFQAELGQMSERKGSKARGGHCLSMQAVSKSANKDARFSGDSFSLNLVTWTIWFSKNDLQTYSFVFDLNQWYKEQMPGFARWTDCSNYILKMNLGDCLSLMAGLRLGPLLDIKMDEKTLQQFLGAQKLEEHFHPYSLSFSLRGSRENDVLFFHNKGLQSLLLAQLVSGGPLCLRKPSDFYRQVLSLGLTPLFTETQLSVPATPETQREIVLNVGLEHQLLGWLCRCASEWSDGSFISVGCSLEFLLDWAFRRALTLKNNCDRYSAPLFDYSHVRLDHNTEILLNSCTRQIDQLTSLFAHILDKLSNYVPNVDLVNEQHATLNTVSVYYNVLQWLVNVGLLPECHPSTYPRTDTDKVFVPFPVLELTKFYDDKRSHLRILSRERFGETNSLLFIDNLLENKCGGEELAKQWQEDGGSGLYPPPSLQSLLRSYFVKGAGLNHKHSLVIYLFLDLATTLDQSRYSSVIMNLIKFPAVFKVSASAIKITQAFWQLDHGDFATAMELLLDPFVLCDDLQPWHHAIVMKSLYLQGQYNYALHYMQIRKPPLNDQNDILTAISLFIANNMLDEAFYFEKQHRNKNEEKLLMHLFKECNKNKSLYVLLYRYLNSSEEKAFFKYLKEVDTPTSNDLKIFYYLLRSRFIEAFDAHQNNRRKKPENQGLVGQRKATATDQVVRIYKALLPDVSRNLVDLVRKERTNLWKEFDRPTPLSVFVHNSKEQIRYKSTAIHAALSKTKQTFYGNLSEVGFKDIETEDTPFLRTPTAARPKSRHHAPSMASKMIVIDDDADDNEPLPAKRLKLTPRPAATSPRKQNVSLPTSMLTPIVRRKPIHSDETYHTNVGTPQSILKSRHFVQQNNAPHETSLSDVTLDEGFKITDLSPPKRSSLGLQPRKSLNRNVKFRETTRFSTSASNTTKSSLNSTSLVDHSHSKSVSSNDISLLVSSKNDSTSADEVFHSMEDSNNDSPNKSIQQEVLPCEEQKEEQKAFEKTIWQEEQDSSIAMQSPRARRSYKRSLDETPHRMSTRSSSILEKTAGEIEEDSSLNLTEQSLASPIDSGDNEPAKQTPRVALKLRGRRSLTRQVLEHNTFLKNTPPPSASGIITRKELSESKTEKTTIMETSETGSTKTVFESSTLVSNVYMSEPKTMVKATRQRSTGSFKKKLLESFTEHDSTMESDIGVELSECSESSIPSSLKEYMESRRKDLDGGESEKNTTENQLEETVDQAESTFNEEYDTNDNISTKSEENQGNVEEEIQNDDNNIEIRSIDSNEELNEDNDDVPMEDDKINIYEDLSSGSEDIAKVLSKNKRCDQSEEREDSRSSFEDSDSLLEKAFISEDQSSQIQHDQQDENSVIVIGSSDEEDHRNDSESSSQNSRSQSSASNDRDRLDFNYERNIAREESEESYAQSIDDERSNISSDDGSQKPYDDSAEEEEDISHEDNVSDEQDTSDKEDLNQARDDLDTINVDSGEEDAATADDTVILVDKHNIVVEKSLGDQEEGDVSLDEVPVLMVANEGSENISLVSEECKEINKENTDEKAESKETNFEIAENKETSVEFTESKEDPVESVDNKETEVDSVENKDSAIKKVENQDVGEFAEIEEDLIKSGNYKEINIHDADNNETTVKSEENQETSTELNKTTQGKEKNVKIVIEQIKFVLGAEKETVRTSQNLKEDKNVETSSEKKCNINENVGAEKETIKTSPNLKEDNNIETSSEKKDQSTNTTLYLPKKTQKKLSEKLNEEQILPVEEEKDRPNLNESVLEFKKTSTRRVYRGKSEETEKQSNKQEKSNKESKAELELKQKTEKSCLPERRDHFHTHVFTPAKRTRSQSLTTDSSPAVVKTLRTRSSAAKDISVEMQSEKKETTMEKPVRRTRSASLDESKPITRKRSLRSNSVELAEETILTEKTATKGRGTVSSVTQLPVIMEEKEKNKNQKSGKAENASSYATSRRLTRRQAIIVKNTEPNEESLEMVGVEPIDPIGLLDKEPFQGKPDEDEAKVYDSSSPSNSSVSSIPKSLTARRERSTSVASDVSTRTSSLKRKTSEVKVSVVTRSAGRKLSESSLVTSETPEPHGSVKRAKKKDDEEASVDVGSTSVRITRRRASSTSSIQSDTSLNSPKRRGRPKKKILPEIQEESVEMLEEKPKRQSTRKKGNQ